MREDALYRLDNEGDVASPALIYYPDIIRENTRKTIEMAGGAARLWPHVKSHKTAELIDMQLAMGIRRFKCATIMELDMTCARGAAHVLLAYPLVGPNVRRYLDTAAKYPATTYYALGDSFEALAQLEAACAERGTAANWLCDVNLGMNRTGVPLDELADFCREAATRFKHLRFMGLHCYDGHNHQTGRAERQAAVDGQMEKVAAARTALAAAGVETPIVIAGGSPSFPCHAGEEGVFLSPGTVFLWDWGYQTSYPDLPFTPGAALLTRVVSHPAPGVFTLDLGSKAIAADPAGQRGYLLEGRGAYPLFQSEELWTWRMPAGCEAERPAIGQVMYVLPTHVCPTSALYRAVKLGVNGRAAGEWLVAARNRD